MAGFVKLDSGILASSVWSEPIETRIVWITILAMADRGGFVAASLSGVQRAANLPIEDVEKAIQTLQSPDTDSRTSAHEGRRIEKIEGGWIILNYSMYREKQYKESQKEAAREGMRRLREERKREQLDEPAL